MKLTDFDYHLPNELIAQTPLEPRDSSRLLMLSKTSGEIEDSVFRNIAEELGENDVLVVNKTRVINARLIGYIKLPSENNSSPESSPFIQKERSN
jgi:S-adenosylmethionine:tRNA ribosyltransferase-isomerase